MIAKIPVAPPATCQTSGNRPFGWALRAVLLWRSKRQPMTPAGRGMATCRNEWCGHGRPGPQKPDEQGTRRAFSERSGLVLIVACGGPVAAFHISQERLRGGEHVEAEFG